MIVLYLNYQVGDITIEQCAGCRTQFLQYEANYCANCLGEAKKSKAAA
jgi:rRNA maturation endonuclease Nob1